MGAVSSAVALALSPAIQNLPKLEYSDPVQSAAASLSLDRNEYS